jgi:protoporphyrinogen oxidase
MGLACTYTRAKAGYKVGVFEADDRIGGMFAAFDLDGLHIERYSISESRLMDRSLAERQ